VLAATQSMRVPWVESVLLVLASREQPERLVFAVAVG